MIVRELGAYLAAHPFLIPLMLVSAALVYLLLRVQVSLREHAAAEMQRLLAVNPAQALERLDNNRRLATVFRKPILTLWRLDAAMAMGDDALARETLDALSAMRLEPNDRLEYYQKGISFYAESGDGENARRLRDALIAFLAKGRLLETEPYADIAREADTIIGVYIDHDTALIKKLIGRAEHTKNDVMRGICQYRVAKLAWFKGDEDLMRTYLNRAEKNLKDTLYASVIAEARDNPAILETK
ncbi:MAG: hypothetical protein IJV41_02240 [Oscillospiraceae bacterium]|nr:hypothetical protein [Oscillospiraceae bacterium]